MEEIELQSRLRERLGLRVGPEMAKYLLKKLADGAVGQQTISAMGGDAKTGIPQFKSISLATLKAIAEDRPTLPA